MLTEHQRRLHAYIYALVPNWTDADEILQETNLRLWEQRDAYDPLRDFSVWARTVALYQVLAFRKRASRRRLRHSEACVQGLATEAAAMANTLDARFGALDRCVQKLRPESSSLLHLCYRGGMTIKDAARHTGRSAAATYKIMARIRRLLHDCIDRTLQRDESP